MKKMLLVLLLGCLARTLASAQQTPGTTAPAARPLTPAEQRQKEKLEREIQRERQIRAEWAQKQREYEAKQAEKERQRLAKKAEKEREQQERETAKSKPVTTPTPVPTTPVDKPAEPVPTVAEPARKQKKEKPKKTPVAEPAPAVTTTQPEVVTPTEPAKTTPAPKAAKPERPKRVKITEANDSVSIASSATEPAVIRASKEFLPKGHLFEPILLDPLEAQTYGSVLPFYYTEGKKYPGSIVPFAFGFAKPFYRRTTEPGRSEEWVLDLASFTQFEAYHDDQLNKARRQIMNNDYKISIIYNVRRGANIWRFRVYHLSSHLGDDYIYRNKITAPTPNSVNYELLDATYSRTVSNWRLYGGLGVVLRKSDERKPLSAQIGAFYKKPSDKPTRLVGGADIKFWQQTNFRPGIHAGIGFELGRTQNNLTFLLEGYSGFRPYSQFEDQQTAWLGIGLYLNPF